MEFIQVYIIYAKYVARCYAVKIIKGITILTFYLGSCGSSGLLCAAGLTIHPFPNFDVCFVSVSLKPQGWDLEPCIPPVTCTLYLWPSFLSNKCLLETECP